MTPATDTPPDTTLRGRRRPVPALRPPESACGGGGSFGRRRHCLLSAMRESRAVPEEGRSPTDRLRSGPERHRTRHDCLRASGTFLERSWSSPPSRSSTSSSIAGWEASRSVTAATRNSAGSRQTPRMETSICTARKSTKRNRRRRVLTACGETQAAFPSRKRRGSGAPAPRPFRDGVYAVLAPRSGNERRSIPAESLRFAPFCVAFRSKYTRASSPGGGSSLTRLVSRAPTGRTGPRPHRED